MTLLRMAPLLTLMAALSGGAAATQQMPEEIVISGQVHALYSVPLEPMLSRPGNFEKSLALFGGYQCSASARGYLGTWEIREGRLYLIRLVSDPCSRTPRRIPLEQIFPGSAQPVIADWYTGLLTLPLFKEDPEGTAHLRDRITKYIVFTVANGKIVGRREDTKASW